ncbi:MAG: type II secretion system GspH family protein [Acidobacteriia bacterium]|nr:type II secretion system GspH family protein [Terriglobia bacterium]
MSHKLPDGRYVSVRHPRSSESRRRQGFTIVELIVAFTIMSILATAALPLARVTIQREREIELRRALREMRDAIDKYKMASDQNMIEKKLDTEGYPPDLQTLVDGVELMNTVDKKIKFLRRIPKDPMMGNTDWGLRSYQDDPDSSSWGGQNVFDVFTKNQGTALDGTKYSDW